MIYCKTTKPNKLTTFYKTATYKILQLFDILQNVSTLQHTTNVYTFITYLETANSATELYNLTTYYKTAGILVIFTASIYYKSFTKLQKQLYKNNFTRYYKTLQLKKPLKNCTLLQHTTNFDNFMANLHIITRFYIHVHLYNITS